MANTNKLRVILIEDDPTITLLLKTVLTKLGHHVVTFPDPTAYTCPDLNKTICFCPQEFPCADIFISDILMPNMSGIDFFKRQRAGGCKVPDENKAFISATENEEHFDAIEELGCNYFKKPFKSVELIKWVETCAERIPEDRILAKVG